MSRTSGSSLSSRPSGKRRDHDVERALPAQRAGGDFAGQRAIALVVQPGRGRGRAPRADRRVRLLTARSTSYAARRAGAITATSAARPACTAVPAEELARGHDAPPLGLESAEIAQQHRRRRRDRHRESVRRRAGRRCRLGRVAARLGGFVPPTARAMDQAARCRRSSSTPAARAAGRGPGCECGRPAATSRSGPRTSGSSARTSPARRPAAFPTAVAARQLLDDRQQQRAPISDELRARPPRSSRPGRSDSVGVASIGPASSSCTTRMIVTPVTGSPAITARCTGAAPRYFGSSDACTLIMPSRGMREQRVRQDPPVCRDHAEVGLQRGDRREKLFVLELRAAEAPERRSGPPAPWWVWRPPAGPGLSADRAATRPRRPSPTAT